MPRSMQRRMTSPSKVLERYPQVGPGIHAVVRNNAIQENDVTCIDEVSFHVSNVSMRGSTASGSLISRETVWLSTLAEGRSTSLTHIRKVPSIRRRSVGDGDDADQAGMMNAEYRPSRFHQRGT